MLNYTVFSSKRAGLVSRLRDDASDSVARLEFARLLRSVGLRSAALHEFRLAEDGGASFKSVGYNIASLAFELGRVDEAIEYLRSRYDREDSDYYKDWYNHYRNLASTSQDWDDRLRRGCLVADQALLGLAAHLKARRFDRVLEMVAGCGMNDPSYPRAVHAFRAATLEMQRQTGTLTWAEALELAELHQTRLRLHDQAGAVLADLDSACLDSEQAIQQIGAKLVGLGNPIMAAEHAVEFLRRHPDSRAARSLLIDCGHAMSDDGCVTGHVSPDWMAAELSAAQQSSAIYFNYAARSASPLPALGPVLAATHRLVAALASVHDAHDGHKAELLRVAAMLLHSDDPSTMIGLPAGRQETVRQLVGGTRLPDAASMDALAPRIDLRRTFSLATTEAAFAATSLAETCTTVDAVSDESDLDTIALLSASTGHLQPSIAEPLIGEAGDGWTHADFGKPFDTVPIFLSRLRASRLIGRGLLVNRNGEAIVDVQNDGIRRTYRLNNLPNVNPIWLQKSGVILGSDKASLVYNRPTSGRVNVVKDACYLLDNGQGYNFANWHMYIYPRLFGYFTSGLDVKGVKLVVYKQTSERLIDFLKGYGFDQGNFYVHDEADVSVFLDLYVPSAMSDIERLLAPQAFRTYDRLSEASMLAAGFDGQSRWASGQLPRKVYLSRSDVPRRRLLNEPAVEDIARRHGFEVVLPAGLSVVDTIRLYRQVDVIAGPSGSSFLNMLYMKAGARAAMISHPLYSPTAYLCCQFGGLRDIATSIVFGKVEGGEAVLGYQEAFSVDENVIEDVLANV